MNVTFLIGNGFDLNLGLATQYPDFLKEYLADNPDDTDEIRRFKEDIRKRDAEDQANNVDRLWSNAELAFGNYTNDVAAQGKTVNTYFAYYDDFCLHLAKYLQKQELRIRIDGHGQDFVDSIQNFHAGLTEIQKAVIDKTEAGIDGGYIFNFIIFNYTNIIDKIIEDIKANKPKFGNRVIRNVPKVNSIGRIIHVHGTTTKDMIFGVNDESQITNMALFEGASPNYLKSFIKQKTNQKNEARTDEKTLDIINSSSCFYIYGMSIGATDTIWWQRIIERMKVQPAVHVYIYGYDAPQETLMQRKRWFYNDQKKEQLLSFATGQTSGLAERIHIVSDNIFEAFHGIALPILADESKSTSADGDVAV